MIEIVESDLREVFDGGDGWGEGGEVRGGAEAGEEEELGGCDYTWVHYGISAIVRR